MNPRTELIFTICGLILTAASVTASVMQYRAGDLQAKAAIVQLKPQIQIKTVLEMINSDKYTDRRLEISNEGGPVYNFHSECSTWVVINPQGIPKKPGTDIEQPMNGYYTSVFPTGNIKGMLETITDYRNNEKFFFISNSLRGGCLGNWDIDGPKTVIYVTYEDSLKEKNEEYYLVDSANVRRLSKEGGQAELERAKIREKQHTPVDLGQLQTSDQLKLWIEQLESLRNQK